MEINRNLAEVLNDLIKINNDRIEGYEKAIAQASESDIDLKTIFSNMAGESRKYIAELSHEIQKLGEPVDDNNTTISGKIYRAWTNLKVAFSGSSRLALLESCEGGEDAAQKAYQNALVDEATVSIDIRQLLANQKKSLQESHDTIRRFRDMHKKSDSDDLVNSNTLRSSDNDLRNDKYLKGVS